MIGRTLAHYDILDRLGKGGMGEVYLARFLTMERVEGERLDRKIPRGGLPLPRFFELAVPLVAAVAAAHESDVTHRDLKPANVLVSGDGRVKVLDFGLAKLRERSADRAADAATEALTREGLVVGTVPYKSPEQVQGQAVDSRSDIFSLGVILYEMLTGRRPFDGKSSAETISALLRDTPEPPDALRARVPRRLGRIVRRRLDRGRPRGGRARHAAKTGDIYVTEE